LLCVVVTLILPLGNTPQIAFVQMNTDPPTLLHQNKFEADSGFRHYPGNTVACMVPRNSKQFQVLVQAQQMLMRSTIGSHFAYLPPSSFHMTVFDLISYTPAGLSFEEKNQFWRESNSKMQSLLAPLMESADWTIFRMLYAPTKSVHGLSLVPSTPRTANALAAWRANLLNRISREENPRAYAFHITLAYTIWPIQDSSAVEELERLQQQMSAYLTSQFGEIELEPPRLTRFHDMSEFIPLGIPSDTALLLGYDIRSGKSVYVHSFEFGANVELRHWQWSKDWSHFVPFCHDGETFYISYKSSDGRVHLVNAKTAHTYMDLVVCVAKPGFTHVVHVETKEGRFATFYNSNSCELVVLKIDIGKSKSSLAQHHATQLPPGSNFSHLVECGGKLVGYSATTGDVAIFHIGGSAKKFSFVAKHQIEKGLSAVTSLKASSPKKGSLFTYSAASGVVQMYSVNEDATISLAFTYSGWELLLTCVVALKIGKFEYVATYRQETGLLRFFKFENNSFSPFSTHTIPTSLTSLTVLGRQYSNLNNR